MGFILGVALIALMIIILLLYKYLTNNNDYWHKRGVPYVRPWPIFGNYLEVFALRTTLGNKLMEFYNEQKTSYFGTFALKTPHLVVTDPELIKLIFNTDFNHFYDRATFALQEIDPIASHVLFLSKNPVWKLLRSKTTSLFTPGKLKNLAEPINKVAQIMIDYLQKNSNKRALNAQEVSVKYVTDVLASFAFSVDACAFESDDGIFKAFANILAQPDWKIVISQHFSLLVPNIVNRFKLRLSNQRPIECLKNIMVDVVKERNALNIVKNDTVGIIGQMLKENKLDHNAIYGDDAIYAQGVQYFLAGFETTTLTIVYTLYELALNSHVQNKLRSEINETLAGRHEFSHQAIQELKYLNAVISETLRKYPLVLFLDRTCVKDYCFPGCDFVIEKGLTVLIPVLALHHDPQYFPEPATFDPERFSDENKNSFPSCAYLPFGQGPRICVGERLAMLVMKLGLIHILLNYEVEVCPQTPIPLTFNPRHFLLLPATDVPLKFKKLVNQ